MKQLLSGYKTYIVAALGILHMAGVYAGWWEMSEEILGLLGLGGMVTLKHASAKAEMAAKRAAGEE